jgi:hypothetical protein
LTEAERRAYSLTDEGERAAALSGVAGTCSHGPDHAAQLLTDAERIGHSITEVENIWVLTKVAQGLAAIDPDRAERFADSLTDEASQKDAALRGAVSALVATETDRAERLARSISEDDFHADALGEVAYALATTDSGRAVQVCSEAESIAQSITDNFFKAWKLSDVAQALAATDPDRLNA